MTLYNNDFWGYNIAHVLQVFGQNVPEHFEYFKVIQTVVDKSLDITKQNYEHKIDKRATEFLDLVCQNKNLTKIWKYFPHRLAGPDFDPITKDLVDVWWFCFREFDKGINFSIPNMSKNAREEWIEFRKNEHTYEDGYEDRYVIDYYVTISTESKFEKIKKPKIAAEH